MYANNKIKFKKQTFCLEMENVPFKTRRILTSGDQFLKVELLLFNFQS